MLTVLIPCKNESDRIVRCIESARLVADEILVADSGSTDDTRELVSAQPDCRLIEREFIGYSSFKNWAIPQASHEWVMILDADERITSGLAAEVHELMQLPQSSFDAYWIGRRTFFLGHEVKYGPWLHDGAIRLLRRDVCRYDNARVHEGIVVEPQRLGKLREKLLHYSIDSYDDYFEKYLRYTSLGAADRWEQGKRAKSWKMLLSPLARFMWLYLARGGIFDGALGIQTCMLQALFVTFVKQARLWEQEHRLEPEQEEQGNVLSLSSHRLERTTRRAA